MQTMDPQNTTQDQTSVLTDMRPPMEPGRYWITFPVGGKEHNRRVLVDYDACGVLRCRWASIQWKLFAPLSADDIGLRVDEMDGSIRFARVTEDTADSLPAVDAGSSTAVDSAHDVAAESTASSDSEVTCDEQSQAPRQTIMDCHGHVLVPGRYFLVASNGRLDPVEILEDQLTFDLWIHQSDKRQRVDELPEAAVLVPRLDH